MGLQGKGEEEVEEGKEGKEEGQEGKGGVNVFGLWDCA